MFKHAENVLSVTSLLQGHNGGTSVVPEAHAETLHKHNLVVWGLSSCQLGDHVLNDVSEGSLDALNRFKHLNNESDCTDGLKLILLLLRVVEDFRNQVEHHIHS